MRAWLLEKVGTHLDLRMGDIPTPQPGKGEVRVRVMAVGLNPVDYKLAARGWPTWSWPHVLGLDVAGEISAVGPEVDLFKKGDRIFYHGDLRKPGGFAAETVVISHAVAAIPGNLSFETAAALPCAGFTAYQAVHDRLHLQAGHTLLVWGSGAVGGFAIQLAHLSGARVFATCTAKTADHVRSLGADKLIDYQTEDVSNVVRELTDGHGVDMALSTISEDTATKCLGLVCHQGALASTQGRPDWKELKPFTTAPSFHEIALGSAFEYGNPKGVQRLAEIGYELGALVSQGKIDPMISRIISFENIPTALDEIANGRHAPGKIVAKVA